MLVMSLVVLGLFSFRDLGVDLFPKADPATVSVQLRLPGASPDEISTAVVEPMEEAISGVSGIDEIQARISEGTAWITVRFVLERDLNDAANDVREKVASAIESAPPELLPPVITKIDPDADPVMSLIVSSDSMSLRTLTELTDKQIARVIQTVNGVGEVSLGGGRAREIHVVVDIEKLGSYGLSLTQVRDAIVAENVEIPGGTVEQGKGQLLLRTLGRVDAVQDFNALVVATRGGTPIRISDIGYAEDTSERPTSAVWLGNTPAVMLDVRRAMGENTVAVIEGVRAKLEKIKQSLPTAVTITTIKDDSRFIYASIESLEEHLLYGSLFATIVVMLFIRNLRAVIISSLAIPASIISSFTLMRVMGFTLNNMTLLAITLSVGIVIDDAIVVLENIFRYIEEKNCSPFEAAIEGTREVALAVMATTLSLVVIFLPIAFMNGYAKRYINPFGWTMAFAIMVSMLVSFTLTPMLSSRFLKLADGAADLKTKEGGFFHWLDIWYTRQVNWALDHSNVIIAISIAVAAGGGAAELHGGPRVRADGRHGRVDDPPGCARRDVAPGNDRDRVQAAEGHQRHRGRRADRAVDWRLGPGLADTHPLPVSGAAAWRAQEHAGANHRGDAATAVVVSQLPAVDHREERARQRRRDRRIRDRGEHPRARPGADRRLLEAGARRGAEAEEPRGREDHAERLESRSARRRGSQARGRPRRADGDHRQHAPAGRRGRRRDFVLQGRLRSSIP